MSEWQKVKRFVTDLLLDQWGARRSWEFFKREWRGLKAGKALLVIIAAICFVSGMWAGCKLQKHRTAKPLSHPQPPLSEPKEWPPLTAAEISSWAQEWRQHPAPKEFTVHYDFPVDAQRLFRSLQAVGKQSGIKVTYSQGSSETQDITITCGTNDALAPSLAKQLRKYRSVRILKYEERTGIVDVWLPVEN